MRGKPLAWVRVVIEADGEHANAKGRIDIIDNAASPGLDDMDGIAKLEFSIRCRGNRVSLRGLPIELKRFKFERR